MRAAAMKRGKQQRKKKRVEGKEDEKKVGGAERTGQEVVLLVACKFASWRQETGRGTDS